MAFSRHLTLLAFFSLLGLTTAAIPSFGLQGAKQIRSGLKDRDFRINPGKGTVFTTPIFTARLADVTTFPALAGTDVQFAIVRFTLKSGASFPRHYHPRGAEALNALTGRLLISFTFEGLGQVRNVTNVIRPGESTVFPQALTHETTCISSFDCEFLSVFNSADVEIVRAPKP